MRGPVGERLSSIPSSHASDAAHSMKRTDSHQVTDDAPQWPFREAAAVVVALVSLALLTHSPSLLRPGVFVMSPADLLLRQPELGGSAEYVPKNRLLIDPVLQFEPWEAWIAHEADAGRFAWWNPFSGTGAPLAANGQSRMFDPLAWMFRLMPGGRYVAAESALRFVLCGLGTWLMAFRMGNGPWVRIWAATAIPMTGFFTFWRLYPLVSAATALPWLWAGSLKVLAMPGLRSCACMALAAAWILAAGNVQVAAVGFCGVAALSLISVCGDGPLRSRHPRKAIALQIAALGCGLTLAAPAWVGLLDYLDRSPVWADRLAEHSGAGRGAKARWADLPCLALPYVFGSERRGDANVAKAVGATNVNEAASGHVGLIATILLIPLSIVMIRSHGDRMTLWALFMTASGLWIGYRLPPVDSLWHRLPVFQGIDPRRFVVLATFGGVLLAGSGLQHIAQDRVGPRFERLAPWFWSALAIGCVVIAGLPSLVREKLEAQARRHYAAVVPDGPDQRRIVEVRVADQMAGLTRSWPAYMSGRGAWLLALAGIWIAGRGRPVRRAVAIGLASAIELAAFGWGYNPQIQAGEVTRRLDMRVIDSLRKLDSEARAKGHEARFLAVGECLPPNQLMRFGLKDLRNYDSIELTATLEGIDDLFESAGGPVDRSSRRAITWDGVRRAAAALKDRGVIGVVGLTRPEADLFEAIIEPIPGVFVGIWPSVPKVAGPAEFLGEIGGTIRFRMIRDESANAAASTETVLRIRESFDTGWRVEGPAASLVRLEPESETGMIRCVIAQEFQGGEIRLTYRPLWYDRTIVPAAMAAVVCMAGLAVPSQASAKKVENVLFRPTDWGLESKNLR